MTIKLPCSFRFGLFTCIAVAFSYLVHEFAHWAMGEILGNSMHLTLNTGYPVAGEYKQPWHYPVISAVGPLTTLLQAVIFYLLIRKYKNKNLFPFLFVAFYLELLSGVMNFRNYNDLGRIGIEVNIGLFTLPLIFVAAHSWMLYKTIITQQYNRRFVGVTFILTLLFASVWTFVNQRFHVVLI